MARVRRRFWLETGLAAASTVLLLVTIAWHDWIEMVFGTDPDHRNGSVEWLIVGMAALAAITCSVLARTEWRRARAAPAETATSAGWSL